jgi:hypothetical protein
MASTPVKKIKKSSFLRSPIFLLIVILGAALAPTYAPNFCWHCIMVVDFFSPTWKAFGSPWVKNYHSYLISRLPDREALPAVELALEGITPEKLEKASHGYTVPVIIRGGVKDTAAIKLWTDVNWWVDNYGDEPVLVSSSRLIKHL